MTKPIPDKAEVALKYPDTLYIGTFERSSRFDAHLDQTGISLTLCCTGEAEAPVRLHLHYGLFSDILRDLADTVSAIPPGDIRNRDALRASAEALSRSLSSKWIEPRASSTGEMPKKDCSGKDDLSNLTPKEEVLLLHALE